MSSQRFTELQDGTLIDLQKVLYVGALRGADEFACYTVVFDHGLEIEIWESGERRIKRSMPRSEFVEKLKTYAELCDRSLIDSYPVEYIFSPLTKEAEQKNNRTA